MRAHMCLYMYACCAYVKGIKRRCYCYTSRLASVTAAPPVTVPSLKLCWRQHVRLIPTSGIGEKAATWGPTKTHCNQPRYPPNHNIQNID